MANNPARARPAIAKPSPDPKVDWMATGVRDSQTVTSDWLPVHPIPIDGVAVKDIRSVPASSGVLTEIWRSEWRLDALPVGQVSQPPTDRGGVPGWHPHAVTTDRLFCASGRIRLSLYDGRKSSPTY